jgi:cation transporter-like permease
MAFAQELKRTVVMGALLAVAVGAIGAQAADPPTPPQSGAPELLLSSLVAPVVVSVVAFFASFAL